MAARRLLFALIVMLVVSSVAAALVPVDRDQDDETTDRAEAREPKPRPPPGDVIERTVDAGRKHPAVVDVVSGDRLVLTVESGRFVEVEIPAFGELAEAEPAAPAIFDLVPTEPGRHPVLILDRGRRIATIAVARDGRSTND